MHQPTSAIALQQAEQSGQLNGKRFEVARAFEMFGPGTSAEVLRRAKLDKNRNLMRARVTELADMGWLKQGEPRTCAVTGRKAIVWTFERTAPRNGANKIKATKAELAEMLTKVTNYLASAADVIADFEPDDIDGETADAREVVAAARAMLGVKTDAE